MNIGKWYWRLVASLLLAVLFIVLGMVTLTKYMPPPTNPFSNFEDLFGANARQIASTNGFTCHRVNYNGQPRAISDYCEVYVTHALFSQVSVALLGNNANEMSFSVRENTLMFGDLAALCGKPEFWQNGDIVTATWPTQHVTAIAPLPEDRRINYFLPIVYVTFIRSGNPRWALLLMMGKLE